MPAMRRCGRAVVACLVVLAAGAVDSTSAEARTVGHGTARSCTSAAVVAAVRAGGTIRFACGARPVTIRMRATAKVRNTRHTVVLDGGGKVTLSGRGRRRILYMNTCDRALVWATPHCQDQATPRLVVRDIAFAGGNATGEDIDGGGGGAIFARGGRLRIERSTFTGNRCDRRGPDVGGGAVRALSQYRGLPVRVTGSSFSGNSCSNGGALSSIGVSWAIAGSRFSGNRAVGAGANPARGGTPGGGSGGAIYNDGNRYRLTITDSRLTGNHANEGGGAVFFVSNDRTGTMAITDSVLERNPSDGFETRGLPGIFFLGAEPPAVTRSVVR
jgi:Chlamydia polymorphic membrane protein (Chlamydia_PMP) repeat